MLGDYYCDIVIHAIPFSLSTRHQWNGHHTKMAPLQ